MISGARMVREADWKKSGLRRDGEGAREYVGQNGDGGGADNDRYTFCDGSAAQALWARIVDHELAHGMFGEGEMDQESLESWIRAVSNEVDLDYSFSQFTGKSQDALA